MAHNRYVEPLHRTLPIALTVVWACGFDYLASVVYFLVTAKLPARALLLYGS